MKDPTNRYLFYRGETLLGTMVHTEDDQPFHIGYIEPSTGFSEVAVLFKKMAAFSQQEDELAELRDEIARPGLRMIGESTGQLRFEPQIFNTDGEIFKWRGFVWHEGHRL